VWARWRKGKRVRETSISDLFSNNVVHSYPQLMILAEGVASAACQRILGKCSGRRMPGGGGLRREFLRKSRGKKFALFTRARLLPTHPATRSDISTAALLHRMQEQLCCIKSSQVVRKVVFRIVEEVQFCSELRSKHIRLRKWKQS
jgi:hypothetical protein